MAYSLDDGIKIYIPGIFDEIEDTEDIITEDSGEGVIEDDDDDFYKSSDKVNINDADEDELQTLPGIGEELAIRIVEYREEYGDFLDIEEIKDVSRYRWEQVWENKRFDYNIIGACFYIQTNDYIFKRIFGHVGNEEITKGLVSAILKKEIYEITLNESPITERDLQDEKVGILDIKARLNNSTLCNIEMQVVNTYNIEKRILFYWSKLYSSEIKKGQNYSCLNPAIAILIADFEIDNLTSISKFHTKWQIREEEYTKIVLTNLFELHIIELPKLIKSLEKNKGIIDNSKDALWSLFMICPEKVGDEVMEKNPEIKKAKEELDKIKQDEREQYLAELRMKYILDQNAVRDYGYEKGKKEGIKEGKKEGIEKGKKDGIKQTKIEIAKKLLEINFPIEQIIEISGLTKEEINEIKQN